MQSIVAHQIYLVQKFNVKNQTIFLQMVFPADGVYSLNQRIMTKDELSFMDFSGEPHKTLENIKLLAQLSARDMTATLLYNLKYFTAKHSEQRILGKKISMLTVWVIADVTTPQGAELLKNALLHMVN